MRYDGKEGYFFFGCGDLHVGDTVQWTRTCGGRFAVPRQAVVKHINVNSYDESTITIQTENGLNHHVREIDIKWTPKEA